ncbi:MAG: rhomboid family intramembrane serine protease, partial [Flavobacterium sp.]
MANFLEDIKNPFRRGNTLVQLMLINGVVFLSLLLTGAILSFIPEGNVINKSINDNVLLIAPIREFIWKPWTLLTYCFTHYSFWHLLFNMLTLYWFGTLVQEFIGSRKLMNIYIIGGIFSGLIYIAIYNLLSLTPQVNNINSTVLGASAAVCAVMFASVTLLPEYEFYFFGLFLIKIKYIAWFFLLLSFIVPSSGISHLGGALAGYSYIYLLRKGVDLGSPIETIGDWWSSLWRPKPKMKIPQRKYSESTVSS